MKLKEPKSMQEIHKIREKHYRQTKGMSLRERLESGRLGSRLDPKIDEVNFVKNDKIT